MTSIRQLESNRRNAQRSPGPTTAAGKARSRQNAWQHGLTAEKILIKGEDVAAFDDLAAEMRKEHQPPPGLEMVLVDRLIAHEWRLRRIPYLEAAILNDRFDEINDILVAFGNARRGKRPHKPVASMINSTIDALQRLARYQTSLRNGFDKTLQQLLFLQDRRRNQEQQERTIELIPSLPSDASQHAFE